MKLCYSHVALQKIQIAQANVLAPDIEDSDCILKLPLVFFFFQKMANQVENVAGLADAVAAIGFLARDTLIALNDKVTELNGTVESLQQTITQHLQRIAELEQAIAAQQSTNTQQQQRIAELKQANATQQ